MNKKIFMRLLTIASFSILLGASQIFAQSQASTGTITGTITDVNDAVVPNATVEAVNKDTGASKTTTTNQSGYYQIPLLRPGTYTVKASGGGFAEQSREAIVNIGRTVSVNFQLGVGDVSAVVNVTGEEVQTTVSNADSVLDNDAISNLPLNGRRFQDLATLTPNVEIDPQRGQLSIGGQKGVDLAINVDGGDFTQPFFGGIRGGERSNFSFTLPQEAVREFQVVSAGYSAEFGRATGGIINVATKGGSNQFGGSAFINFRGDSLARTNGFADALIAQSGVTDPQVAADRYQFGGSFGGPIIKDKFFFFGTYEQQNLSVERIATDSDLSDSSIINPVVPLRPEEQAVLDFFRTQEGPFTLTNDVWAGSIRVDGNFNEKNNANFRFNFSRNDAENAVNTGETSLNPTTDNALSNDGIEGSRTYTYVGQWTSFINSTFTNEFRGQYSRGERPRLANSAIPNVESNLLDFGLRSFMPTTQFDTRLQFSNNLIAIAGDHTAKFGVDFQRIKADQDFGFGQLGRFFIFPTSGTSEFGRVPGYFIGGRGRNILTAMSTLQIIDPMNRDASYFGRFDDARTGPNDYSRQIGNLEAAFSVSEMAFFAQDSWRASPNLTFNFGLRVSKQWNPSPETGNTALIDVMRNASFPLLGGSGFDPTVIPDSPWQFGPRLGFAYDPKGDGKSVFRGFFGMFYSRTPLLLFAGAMNNYRTTPGDLQTTFSFLDGSFDQAAFDAANPQYTAIVGMGVRPSTVYRLFAVAGIDLNNFALDNLPILTVAQLNSVNAALEAASPGANPSTLGAFTNSFPFGIAPDFKNPTSAQWGFGYELELAKDFYIGFDFANVNAWNRQRNININLPPATAVTPIAMRPDYQRRRVVSSLGSIQLRQSSAKSTYKSFTVRSRYSNNWLRFQASYTLSKNTSDDDNERSATGFQDSENQYDRSSDYGFSTLDRTHRFTASPIFFLPFGVEFSTTMRLRSGNPFDAAIFRDVNNDAITGFLGGPDRPYIAPGVPMQRNSFRNKPIYDIDMRVQKGINFDERKRLVFTAEFFNVFNLENIQYGDRLFCSSRNEACGLSGATNSSFMQIRDSNGNFITRNNLGSQIFQTQIGARFEF
ncbi:MAG: TonB-dependent receptor [Pyrinomonadaceae bacterium]|nr:TonB-dependent receptor [Pyrinomonadaceae bacterium]